MKKVFIIFNKGKQKEFVISAINKAGTEKHLSKKVGISQASLYDYKNEIRSIPLERVKILAIFLGLILEEILIQTKEKYIVRWTKGEEKFVLENYKLMTAREISRKLNKTIDSIKHKRKTLGLKKGPAYRWDKQRIYSIFKDILKISNKVPTYQELTKKHSGMVCAIERIWGKYSNFLKDQGLKTSIRKWSKKKCIYEFEKLRVKIKKIPTQNNLKKCRGLSNAIRRRWKTYNLFLKHLGHSPNFELKWNKEKCQTEFEKIILKRSRPITIHELLKINPSLVAAIYKYFNSYPALLKSLEYEANDDWQKWEKLVTKICKKIYPNVIVKPRLKNNKFPDVAIGDKEPFETIIDAKLNSFANSIPLGIKKYKTSCRKLEFWCLLGSKKLNRKTIRIRGYNEIRSLLRNKNEEDLIKELEGIIK